MAHIFDSLTMAQRAHVGALCFTAGELVREEKDKRIAELEAVLRDIAYGNWSSPTVDSEAANVYAQIVNEMQSRARAALPNT